MLIDAILTFFYGFMFIVNVFLKVNGVARGLIKSIISITITLM